MYFFSRFLLLPAPSDVSSFVVDLERTRLIFGSLKKFNEQFSLLFFVPDVRFQSRTASSHASSYARSETLQMFPLSEKFRKFVLLVAAHANPFRHKAVRALSVLREESKRIENEGTKKNRFWFFWVVFSLVYYSSSGSVGTIQIILEIINYTFVLRNSFFLRLVYPIIASPTTFTNSHG